MVCAGLLVNISFLSLLENGLIREIGESQRLVQSSALQVNDRKIGDHREKIAVEDLVDGHIAIVRAGNKRQIILYVE